MQGQSRGLHYQESLWGICPEKIPCFSMTIQAEGGIFMERDGSFMGSIGNFMGHPTGA
jgi:hypothetical protein